MKENKLTLLEPTKMRSTNGCVIWKCLCECGNISYHVGYQVKRNIITSCGCGRRSKNLKESISKMLYQDYKWRAKKKNVEFLLTHEEFKEMIFNACYYCGSDPSVTKRNNKFKSDFQILTNGIDRKNNDVGYTKENCVSCCKICNKAKNNLTYNEWMNWLNRVSKYHKKAK